MDIPKKGMGYTLFAVLLWSTLGVGFKLVVSDVDSFTVTFGVGLVATVFLFFNLVVKRKVSHTFTMFNMHKGYVIIVGIIGLGIHPLLYLNGYAMLPASTTVAIFYTYPLFMILFSALFTKDHISKGSFFSLAVGFVGVLLIVTNGSLMGFTFSMGTIVTVLASMSWALFSFLISSKKLDSDSSMFLFNLFGFIFLCG